MSKKECKVCVFRDREDITCEKCVARPRISNVWTESKITNADKLSLLARVLKGSESYLFVITGIFVFVSVILLAAVHISLSTLILCLIAALLSSSFTMMSHVISRWIWVDILKKDWNDL